MTQQPHRIARLEETAYTVPELIKFHGHLGPYIVLGYRMGRFAREYFGNSPELVAAVRCPDTPPQSCIADGIQLGSGCSFGRGKISLILSEEISCSFTCKEKTLVLHPVDTALPPPDSPAYWKEIEEIALIWYDTPAEYLFSIR